MGQPSSGSGLTAELARQHELRGDLVGAEALWLQSLGEQPADYKTRLGHGRVLFLLGRYPDAIRTLLEALECDTRGAEAQFFLSRAMYEQGELALAQSLFLQAIDLDPLLDHPSYRERLFGVYTEETPSPSVELNPEVLAPPAATPTPHHVQLGLRHFWGAADLKAQLHRSVVEPLAANPSTSRSYLLFGPQDCGKRFLSRCVAGDLGARLLELDGDLLEHPDARSLIEGRLHAFLRDGSPHELKAIHLIRWEKVASLASGSRKDRHGLPPALHFLAPVLDHGGTVVCFHTDVPWLLPRTLRHTPWMQPGLLVPPPDAEARGRLFDNAFGDALPGDVRALLVQRTEGFTTADVSAVTILMEEHTVRTRGRDTERVKRYLQEDRTFAGHLDWSVAAAVVSKVVPTAVEWFKEARRVRFHQHHPELLPYYERLIPRR